MKSQATTYYGLFGRRGDGLPVVKCIEIPMIQRDYAQGREDDKARKIREDFLGVLHRALTTDKAMSLDFVYGEIADGKLCLLDGQQRLTTLFLLHWYFAWRAERLSDTTGWQRFEYATRPSARRFCEQLVESAPPAGSPLRAWFEDQAWFLHTWQHDPTITAMLVMLEAIHERFSQVEPMGAWARLTDSATPAISFHLLPIEQLGLSDELYIKMNSRGKPLTEFETFKARFEQLLEKSYPERVAEISRKIDGDWADLLWPYRGSDNLVDDEFLRYFTFVSALCAWREDRKPNEKIADLAEAVYGPGNSNARENVDFLVRAFDAWIGTDTEALFNAHFVSPSSRADTVGTSNDVRVVLFGPPGSTLDLFKERCESEAAPGAARTLLLYAFLLHRLHDTVEFQRRLRMLRNLIDASGSELRAERMSALIADVKEIIVDGNLGAVKGFNQSQVAEERSKREFLAEFPSLERSFFQLEDHALLRGSLGAFELDATVFEARALAFHRLFKKENLIALTGALLAVGDYSRPGSLRLGSSVEFVRWRDEILAGVHKSQLSGIRHCLGVVLDYLSAHGGEPREVLTEFAEKWLQSIDPSTGLDWRWYLVRYPVMRAGSSGLYASSTGEFGYSLCMLDKRALNSYYRDPFVSATVRESAVGLDRVQGAVAHWSGEPGFTGYPSVARVLRLVKSGTTLEFMADGVRLGAPAEPSKKEKFARVCETHGVDSDLRLKVSQVSAHNRSLDTQDRVSLAAAMLRDLVAAGL